MKFNDLQEKLREIASANTKGRRRGPFTGSALATRAGIRQSHLSNFLNRKRGLSLEAMDDMLEALGLSVTDLCGLQRKETGIASNEYETVELVSADAVEEPIPRRDHLLDARPYRATYLRRIRAAKIGERDGWTRFILLAVDRSNAEAMCPILPNRGVLLVDRHYNSLEAYRGTQKNIYVVRSSGLTLLRYVELNGGHLLFRPHNLGTSVQSVEIPAGQSATDYIIGRVCHVATEL